MHHYVSYTDLKQEILQLKSLKPTVLQVYFAPFQSNSDTYIQDFFHAIPSTVSSINLDHVTANMTKFVSNLPASIRELNIHSCDDYGSLFTNMPFGIHTLRIKASAKGNLKDMLASIPSTITSLDISDNDFPPATKEEHLDLPIAKLPPTITHLGLAESGLWLKSQAELFSFLQAIPSTVRSLDLSFNGLSAMNNEELKAMLAAIPPWITQVNLSNNRLGDKTGEELAAALTALHPQISHLNLSDNYLEKKLINSEWPAIITALRPSLFHLDLSKNYFLVEFFDAEYVQLLSKIPENIKSLNLNHCFAGVIEAKKLAMVLAAIPKHIRNLHLGNISEFIEGDTLAEVLQAIRAPLTKLDLSMHDYTKGIYDRQLPKALARLPATIRQLTLSMNQLQGLPQKKLRDIGKSLNNVIEVILVNNNGRLGDCKELRAINASVGQAIFDKFQTLKMGKKKLPESIIYKILSFETGIEDNALQKFMKQRIDSKRKDHRCVKEFLSKLKENLNSAEWDNKGFAFPFFDKRKTPTGIIKLRKVLNNRSLSSEQQMDELLAIAHQRLNNVPWFTARSKVVSQLYETLASLEFALPEELVVHNIP